MSPGRLRSPLLAAAGAVLMGLAAACARQGSPPGGERDLRPPVVIATTPDTFSVLDVVDDPIRIEFNERISERPTEGNMDDAVLVSPRTGEVRVEHKRSGLEVDLAGGVRPGLVYRVTVLPVVQDMFNNPMRAPFEFVFSTGADFEATAVAGLVLDRLTARPVAGARVIARRVGGDTSVVYTARTDTGGIYALRYLPPGEYELVAFEDRNRDFRPGGTEIQGRRTVEVTDTVISDLIVLEPDTTAARLADVEPTDSAVLTVTFDDHLEPSLDPEDDLRIILDVDSTTPGDAPRPPDIVRTFHPWQWEARVDSLRAARDTSSEREAEPATREEPEGLIPGPLPSRELRVLLDRALPVGVPYRLNVEGVVNVAGLTGGGGSRVVVREEAVREVREDTVTADSAVAPDSAAVSDDTTAAPPDTGGVALPDTTPAPPDTGGVALPDTTAPLPDTTVAPPDTGSVAEPDTTGLRRGAPLDRRRRGRRRAASPRSPRRPPGRLPDRRRAAAEPPGS